MNRSQRELQSEGLGNHAKMDLSNRSSVLTSGCNVVQVDSVENQSSPLSHEMITGHFEGSKPLVPPRC